MTIRTYILHSTEMGRELHTWHNIEEGQHLFTFEILPLSEKDSQLINQTDLKYYVYTLDDKRNCLVLGEGELFNHSDTPNVRFELQDFDGRKVMAYFATRRIEGHEQLFIDYRQDDKSIDLNEYTVNLVETKKDTTKLDNEAKLARTALYGYKF